MARRWNGRAGETFPFLFGGTFIEGTASHNEPSKTWDFPSFSEGLSLRAMSALAILRSAAISLPFRRDFH